MQGLDALNGIYQIQSPSVLEKIVPGLGVTSNTDRVDARSLNSDRSKNRFERNSEPVYFKTDWIKIL